MPSYHRSRDVDVFPRLPLEGSIDLTYRCNNDCVHCWLRIPPDALEKQREISLEEIKGIVDDARKMGCRTWRISGGEAMLRPDFKEILDYVSKNSVSYTLNTNGTMVTPEIAELLKRNGTTLVSLYGATPEVHDKITRRSGSFRSAVRGISQLKEAGCGFTVQIVPMRDNRHQFEDMVGLAKTLSPRWRIGASWLYLSAYGDPAKNCEIRNQRLAPSDVVELSKPEASSDETRDLTRASFGDDRLFASCISQKQSFHLDPYGQMSFCAFVKDPGLRYDLRRGSFEEAWNVFIPSLGELRGGSEYLENCGSCERRVLCRWCPVYGYLEHGRLSARVEYLCDMAGEAEKFREDWRRNHQRWYGIGGFTLKLESDRPISSSTFHPKFESFEIEEGRADISIRHHFTLPDLKGKDLGEEAYHRPPWSIYRKGDSWIYLTVSSPGDQVRRVAVFNSDHSRALIYNQDGNRFNKGSHHSLTLFPTDQILLGAFLANRDGCLVHSSGVVLKDSGLLFVGHSEAGKSTIVKMLRDRAEILCDDRIIVRRLPDGFRIYGTWSHGEVEDVSAGSAPLRAILFLEKAEVNRVTRIERPDARKRLLACVVKPLVTAKWWKSTLNIIEEMVLEVPCYLLQFDKSGRAVSLLENL